MKYLFLIVLVFMAGCSQPETDFQGQKVNAQNLQAVQDQAIAKAKEEATRQLEEVAAAQKRHENEFKRKVASLDLSHQDSLNELAAKYEQDSEAVQTAVSRITRQSSDAISAIKTSGDAAAADLQRQFDQRSMGLNIVGQALSFVPGGQAFAPLVSQAMPWLLGIGGTGLLMRSSKKREDAAWDESEKKAKEEADAKAKAEAAAWDQAQQHLMMLLHIPRPSVTGEQA